MLLTVNNTNTTDILGAFHLRSTVNGLGGFQKWGAGMATFSTGSKLYQGATVVNDGRMCITQKGQPSKTSSITVNTGGQLTLIASGNFAMGPGPLTLNGAGPTTVPYAAFPGAIRNAPGLTVVISNSVVLQSDTLLHVQAAAGSGSSLTPTGSMTFAGPISGPGHLSITAPNSSVDVGSVIFLAHNNYSGGTTISGGSAVARGPDATFGSGDVYVDNSASPSSIARLVIESNAQDAIADSSMLSLAGGGTNGVADQGYIELGSGINEVVGRLKLAGVIQTPGTYGSSASPATFKNDEFFSGAGIITVRGPMLNISISGTNVVLSWPTNAGDFVLQSAGSPTGSWTNNNSPVEIFGVDNTVTESATELRKMYRLANQ